MESAEGHGPLEADGAPADGGEAGVPRGGGAPRPLPRWRPRARLRPAREGKDRVGADDGATDERRAPSAQTPGIGKARRTRPPPARERPKAGHGAGPGRAGKERHAGGALAHDLNRVPATVAEDGRGERPGHSGRLEPPRRVEALTTLRPPCLPACGPSQTSGRERSQQGCAPRCLPQRVTWAGCPQAGNGPRPAPPSRRDSRPPRACPAIRRIVAADAITGGPRGQEGGQRGRRAAPATPLIPHGSLPRPWPTGSAARTSGGSGRRRRGGGTTAALARSGNVRARMRGAPEGCVVAPSGAFRALHPAHRSLQPSLQHSSVGESR